MSAPAEEAAVAISETVSAKPTVARAGASYATRRRFEGWLLVLPALLLILALGIYPLISSLLLALLPAAGLAQAPIEREGRLEPRQNQKIEFIRIEDAGNRIDEVRVGSQTQSIRVQPKTNVPAYEVPGNDMARNRDTDTREGSTGSRQRVWNFLNF